jgi:hypothetical protein
MISKRIPVRRPALSLSRARGETNPVQESDPMSTNEMLKKLSDNSNQSIDSES